MQRSIPRAEVVPAEAIAGTVRHPSNTTADFLPIGALRSTAWHNDWRRVLEAYEHLWRCHRELEGRVVLLRRGRPQTHRGARRTGAAVDATVVDLRLPMGNATAA
jgi:hypothetical protein